MQNTVPAGDELCGYWSGRAGDEHTSVHFIKQGLFLHDIHGDSHVTFKDKIENPIGLILYYSFPSLRKKKRLFHRQTSTAQIPEHKGDMKQEQINNVHSHLNHITDGQVITTNFCTQ